MKQPDNASGWNKISQSYQRRYAIGTDKFYWGPLCSSKYNKWMGPVRGKDVLELGSGAGQNAIFLARQGARVTALDFSSEQIKHGKRLARLENAPVNFMIGDFERLNDYFMASSFDLIISAFALQYTRTTKSLQNVMKQAFALLKSGGTLVFSVDHPLRDHGHWSEHDDFIVNNYFDRKSKTWSYDFPEDDVSAVMCGCFKTISDYLCATIDAGFKISDVAEPKPIAIECSNNFATKSRYIESPSRNPFTRGHLKRIPGTLIVKATKE
jgi:SAM-dependent methyltransferase